MPRGRLGDEHNLDTSWGKYLSLLFSHYLQFYLSSIKTNKLNKLASLIESIHTKYEYCIVVLILLQNKTCHNTMYTYFYCKYFYNVKKLCKYFALKQTYWIDIKLSVPYKQKAVHVTFVTIYYPTFYL